MAYPTSPAPQFVYEEELAFRTIITDYESGKEQRQRLWSNGASKRVFTLVYNALTQAEMETIRDHFRDSGDTGEGEGAYQSFTFTNRADSAGYTVRYMDDNLRIQAISMYGSAIRYSVGPVKLITTEPITIGT